MQKKKEEVALNAIEVIRRGPLQLAEYQGLQRAGKISEQRDLFVHSRYFS